MLTVEPKTAKGNDTYFIASIATGWFQKPEGGYRRRRPEGKRGEEGKEEGRRRGEEIGEAHRVPEPEPVPVPVRTRTRTGVPVPVP